MTPPDPDESVRTAKERERTLWGKGDYGEVARRMQPAADALVTAAGVSGGDRVIDVAAGTGNVAVAAARHGARVVATDLSPALVERGQARCRAAGLDIEWREADAEDLPFGEASFDAALSAFGVVYAPSPGLAAAELFRVVGHDGAVGVVNWAADSFQEAVGRALTETALGAGSASAKPVVDWGDEDAVAALFTAHAATIETARERMWWAFDSVTDWLDRAEQVAPPLVALRETLVEEAFERVRESVAEAAEPFVTRTAGGVLLEQAYVIVTARKR